jgi:UrcA family protein
MMKTSLILVAAAAMAVPAAAAEPGDGAGNSPAHVRQIAHADLNLESDAGRAELRRRMERAVASICSVDGLPASFALDAEKARCIAETSAGLDAKMDAAVRASRANATRMASARN